MISGADQDNKGAYLTALISKVYDMESLFCEHVKFSNIHKLFWVQHQVTKLGLVGLYGFPSSASRVTDMSTKEPELSSYSRRAQYPAYDSTSSHLEYTATRLVRSYSIFSVFYRGYLYAPLDRAGTFLAELMLLFF